MDPVERVKSLTNGGGADKGCECVGWQAHDPKGHEQPNAAMNRLVQSVRLQLDAAPDAYEHFDARENGWTKVVLKVAA